MKTGKPLADQVWLVMGHDGMPRWYLCTKIPLFGHRGAVVGALLGAAVGESGIPPRFIGELHGTGPLRAQIESRAATNATAAQSGTAGTPAA